MYKLIFDAFLGPLQRSHKGQRCVKSGKFLPVTDRVGQVIDNFRNISRLFAKQASALVQSLNRYQLMLCTPKGSFQTLPMHS